MENVIGVYRPNLPHLYNAPAQLVSVLLPVERSGPRPRTRCRPVGWTLQEAID